MSKNDDIQHLKKALKEIQLELLVLNNEKSVYEKSITEERNLIEVFSNFHTEIRKNIKYLQKSNACVSITFWKTIKNREKQSVEALEKRHSVLDNLYRVLTACKEKLALIEKKEQKLKNAIKQLEEKKASLLRMDIWKRKKKS